MERTGLKYKRDRRPGRTDSRPPARPDVFTGLWPSESGIPADPPTGPLTGVFAVWRGWCSNRIPNLIPNVIPCVNPQRKK
jgi:hypothetical protein